jgi:hypothetical protein
MDTDPYGAVTQTAEGLVAVGVNTARRLAHHIDWSRGRINARQLDAILDAFDEASGGALRVVVAHHPFLLTGRGRDRGLVGRSTLALRPDHRLDPPLGRRPLPHPRPRRILPRRPRMEHRCLSSAPVSQGLAGLRRAQSTTGGVAISIEV